MKSSSFFIRAAVFFIVAVLVWYILPRTDITGLTDDPLGGGLITLFIAAPLFAIGLVFFIIGIIVQWKGSSGSDGVAGEKKRLSPASLISSGLLIFLAGFWLPGIFPVLILGLSTTWLSIVGLIIFVVGLMYLFRSVRAENHNVPPSRR